MKSLWKSRGQHVSFTAEYSTMQDNMRSAAQKKHRHDLQLTLRPAALVRG